MIVLSRPVFVFASFAMIALVAAGCGGGVNSPQRGEVVVPIATPGLHEQKTRTAPLPPPTQAPEASPFPATRHGLARRLFTDGSDSSIDICPGYCVIPGQSLAVPVTFNESSSGSMTMVVDNANQGFSIAANPPTISGPPYVFSLTFKPNTSVTTNRYYYDYYFVFTPNSGQGYTTGKEPEQIDTACSINMSTCPKIQIYDSILAKVTGASPAPTNPTTTIVGRGQKLKVRWQSGTGASGVTYTLLTSPEPSWTLNGTAVSSYPLATEVNTGSTPVPVATPISTTAPKEFYWFTENETAGPYSYNATVSAMLQGVVSSNYTEIANPEAIAPYNVQEPTGIMLNLTLAQVQVSTSGNEQYLGPGDFYTGMAGALYSFAATPTDATPANAHFAMIQLLQPCLHIDSTDEGYPDLKLDGDGDTPSGPFYGSATPPASSAYTTRDTPGIAIPNYMSNYPISSFYGQDHFLDLFYYKPSAINSNQATIWVPIASQGWYWYGTASRGIPPPYNPFTLSGGNSSGVTGAQDDNPPTPPTWSGTFEKNYANPYPGCS